jgi:branched-chain amino acid transport system ATP-binding protein
MILEVQGLTKSFGGLVAVSGVDLAVAEGEIVGLIGPNGAGKTTLFNLITGLLEPSAGSVRFLGQPVAGRRPHAIAEMGMARTFQNIRLFGSMSARENVVIGTHCRTRSGVLGALFKGRATREEEGRAWRRAEEELAFVGLSDLADSPAGGLAYGQQRRLEIARALATDPKLLCLDEPAAGMNETESAQLIDLVRRIQQRGITVLIIEHDMHVVMNLCDRIAVLNFGKKLAEGTPAAIRANPDVIEAYLGRDDDAAH